MSTEEQRRKWREKAKRHWHEKPHIRAHKLAYAARRYQEDPEFRSRKRAIAREWDEAHRGASSSYYRRRYQEDPEFRRQEQIRRRAAHWGLEHNLELAEAYFALRDEVDRAK